MDVRNRTAPGGRNPGLLVEAFVIANLGFLSLRYLSGAFGE